MRPTSRPTPAPTRPGCRPADPRPKAPGGNLPPAAPARLNTLPDLGAFCEACDGGGGLNAYLSLSHS